MTHTDSLPNVDPPCHHFRRRCRPQAPLLRLPLPRHHAPRPDDFARRARKDEPAAADGGAPAHTSASRGETLVARAEARRGSLRRYGYAGDEYGSGSMLDVLKGRLAEHRRDGGSREPH